MNRIIFIALGIVALLLSFLLLRSPVGDTSGHLRYVPNETQPTGSYFTTHYDWIDRRPFINDKVWIFGKRNLTNDYTCLYDLKKRMILGELHNGGVELVNGDDTKLLVTSFSSATTSLKEKLFALVEKLSGGKIKPNFNRTETYWILNLKDNSSKPLGSVTQYSGTGSRWYTSPGLRFGCTSPTTENESAFILFDFEQETFQRISVAGRIRGWWDEQNILLQSASGDFVIYNVVKRQTTSLFSRLDVQHALAELNFSLSKSTSLEAFANWNGCTYDFYFTESGHQLQTKPCFLLKAERTSPKPTLKLIDSEFQFHWGGEINADASSYLYQGESGAPGDGGDGGVYLRGFSDNSVRTLVPPDNKGRYAIPRFYGDEVIYFRDRVLWRIGLDGSNNAPLFLNTNSQSIR